MTDPKRVDIVSAEWRTQDEACAELKIQLRTLQTWAQLGFIKWKRQSVPGRRPYRVYAAKDIAHLKEHGAPAQQRERDRAPKALPARQQQYLPRENVPARLSAPERPALWLSLEQAAAYSGLAESYLKQLIDENELEARRGGPFGAWRIQRAALEAWPRKANA